MGYGSPDLSVTFNAEGCAIGKPAFDETVAALGSIPGVKDTTLIVNAIINSAVCNLTVRKNQRDCIPAIGKQARTLKYVASVWEAAI